MLIERLTEEELALYEVLRHPVWCYEFLSRLESEESVFEFTSYQKEILLDFNNMVSIRAGRAVGKTQSLIAKITWHAVNGFFREVLYTVPNRSHLDPVFLGIQKKFRVNPFLKYWLGRFSVNAQQFMIKFMNNFTLICRIAGTSGTGVNVVGLHVPVIILDESSYYDWRTWVELQQVLNDWEEGNQMVVAGVPDGRREKSVLYACDTSPSFTKHRISAYDNPRFTKEAEQRAIEQFGGKDSQDFIRQVLGEHGTPTFSMFDRENMRIEEYMYPTIRVFGDKIKSDVHALDRIAINLPLPPKRSDSLVLGVDLGFTEPTAIIALYLLDNIWYILFRVELHQVNYDIQERFIDDLNDRYNFNFIGLDVGAGGQGKAVYNDFLYRPEFKNSRYEEKIIPVEFGGTVVVGVDESGKELKERVKPFSVTKLQQMVNSYEIAFSRKDDDLLTELERITYSKSSATGQIVYKASTPGGGDRGADHNFAALLTFAMVVFNKYDALLGRPNKPKLYKSKWIY